MITSLSAMARPATMPSRLAIDIAERELGGADPDMRPQLAASRQPVDRGDDLARRGEKQRIGDRRSGSATPTAQVRPTIDSRPA